MAIFQGQLMINPLDFASLNFETTAYIMGGFYMFISSNNRGRQSENMRINSAKNGG